MSSFDCLRQAPTRTTACGFLMSGLLLIGCGSEAPKGPPRVPLAGTVTFDGQPLGGADITFFNQEDEVGMITSAEGNYKIPIGARPGSYKVTVSKLKGLENIPEGVAVAPSPGENPEMIPPQFSSRSLTKLTYTVPEEGTETANFDLSTK